MPKAVIFTHINVKATSLLVPTGFDTFYEHYGSLFESCLSCKNIGLVFVYCSYGIEEYVRVVISNPTQPVEFSLIAIEGEERIFNALNMAVDTALDNLRKKLGRSFLPASAPKFVFVGVRELASLLNKLWLRDPRLVLYLANQGNFTYDSPKFVEAVIRLARGSADDAKHPILRIDADVELNTEAVQKIIDQTEILRTQHNQYWWFSGCYSGNFSNDPVNEHAVRQHWLIDPSTWNDPDHFTLLPGAETFLRDLSELGATQVTLPQTYSTACKKLIDRRGISMSRPTPQVISGAGLVASIHAIRRLPPFMNANDMIVWIDDHLKRQLHEAIGDILPNAPERIDGARLRQNRHPKPKGIENSDIEWARSTYFRRLLGGCLMQATIKDVNGKAGPLARWIKQITLGIRKDLSSPDEIALRNELQAAAESRFDEVLEVWRDADYGNNVLKDWTNALTTFDKDVICSSVGESGVSYINLLLMWPDYVWAIQDLGRLEAYWLFTRVWP